MKLLRALGALAFSLVTLSVHARAELRTQAVEYKHGDVVLEGYLAYDDALANAKSPAPGVVVCPEWWGNTKYAHDRAEMLAKLGYVAFAIDMYGKGKTTTDPKVAGEWSGAVMKDMELRRARARAGYDVLAARPEVDKQRMGAIGYCMGGTVALELARGGAPLVALVVFHAGSLLAAGDDAAALADNSRIKAFVTVCHGQDDAFVPKGDVDRFHAQMKAAKIDYQFIAYAGAVHAFTNPDADTFKIPGIAYNAHADARSWAALKSAFAEAFLRK